MKRYLQIVLISFLLVGCASPLKQSWYDFTAYYNTFYNAKQYYAEGVKLNQRQVPDLNAATFIRIHTRPTAGGQEQFEQSIERGASILRNHENSKYVNPALLLIGKSYFHRSEYFSALEKFQELQAIASGRELQKAILWQGRTYLEMSAYDQGLRTIEVDSEYIPNWDREILAEVNAVRAQLYVAVENWNNASIALHRAAGELSDRELRSRAYFLHGQVLEEMENSIQALAAYKLAADAGTDYSLEFNALRKQAEMSRRSGNYDQAIRIYRSIERDDKFFDYRLEMRYEIARTYQEKGESEEARKLYANLLHNRFDNLPAITRAKAYFGLAEIYRDNLNSFTMAAAYFDSAASMRIDAELLPAKFNAGEQAASFGEYATLKREIGKIDSLMHLSALSPAELDSVVAVIRNRLLAEQEQQARGVSRGSERVIVRDISPDEVIDAAESVEFGFLNVKSQQLLTDASLQFQAIWGDRPLADNWRRRAAVSGSRFDQPMLSNGAVQESMVVNGENNEVEQLPGIDLSEIPFTESEKREMTHKKENLRYRLANLFFLNLDMPDSAKVYYEKVIQQDVSPELTSRALYSITELELLEGNREEADHWSERLIHDFPESVYSERIADRMNISHSRPVSPDLQQNAKYRYSYIMKSDTVSRSAEKAMELQEMAMKSASEAQRPLLLFEAARQYMAAAMEESENRELVSAWLNETQRRERRLPPVTEDDTKAIDPDSDLNDAAIELEYPFEGAYWDSTRSVLNYISSNYPSSQVMNQVEILLRSLEKPDQKEDEMATEEFITEPFPEELMPRDPAPDPTDCFEMGFELDYEGGMEAFMNSVRYPEWTEEVSMKGEITYLLEIDADGSVNSYEQISRMDRTGIPQAIEEAIDRGLRFHPHPERRKLNCSITFPIEL